jgi:hypothetical protein
VATDPHPDDGPTIRARRVREAAIVVGLYVVAGILGIVGGPNGVTIAAFTVFGIADVLAVVFVFYEIGLGEDRDRARGRL